MSDSIREMVRRAVLEALGEQPSPGEPREYRAPWTGVAYDAHPSQKLFPGAGGPSLEILQSHSRQECVLEKNRGCDDCGKCRSLGF